MSWLQQQRPALRRLFGALGMQEHWTDDDETLVSYMERAWLGTEHGPSPSKQRFDDDAVARAWPVLRELGVVERLPPARTTFDQVVVMGAAGIGLHRRLELVRTSEVAAPVLWVLAGQRPHSGLPRDGALSELLDPQGRFGSAAGWSAPGALSWQAQLLERAGVPDLVAAQVALPSETDIARLLLRKQWPTLQLVGTERATPRPKSVTNELGQREFVLEQWHGAEGFARVLLLNGAPVDRHKSAGGDTAPPRPTSRSTLAEWLDGQGSLDPESLKPGHRVLAVVNQPHLARVELDVRDALEQRGLADVELTLAGCEALPSSDLNLLLGELPARARADARRSTGGRP